MSTSRDSATAYHRSPNSKVNDMDSPPTGTEEELIARISLAARSAATDNAIKNHVLAAFSLGLIPIPLFDFVALAANQMKMVHTLAGIYGGEAFRDIRLKALVLALLGGAVPVLSVRGLSSGLKIMPGIGSLVGSGTVAVGGGLLTYAVGRVFVKHFESGGVYLRVDKQAAREQIRKEMERGRGFVFDLWKKARGAQPGTA